jgi:hypothetical protein
MPGVLFGREFIGLAQRMDIEIETVTVEKNWDLNKWDIGVHYSVASHHGAYARKDYPRFNASRQGWIEVLEGMGYQYDMVAADMKTGFMDEHCKLHASGSLDGLFGIERF